MSYKKALQHFLSLPEDQQKLGYGKYYDNASGYFCAIGSLVPSVKIMPFYYNQHNIVSISYHAKDHEVLVLLNILDELKTFGLTIQEAERLQDFNDISNRTVEERYLKVVEFLQLEVAKETNDLEVFVE